MTNMMVLGGTGYIGSAILSNMRDRFPDRKLTSISFSGKTDSPLKNVQYVKSDITHPNVAYGEMIRDSNVIVHSVGTLLENPRKGRMYAPLSTDSVVKTISLIQSHRQNDYTKIIYISSSRGLPFLNGYLSSKRNAEIALFNFAKANPKGEVVILRPGVVWSPTKFFTVPLAGVASCAAYVERSINRTIKSAALASVMQRVLPCKPSRLEAMAFIVASEANLPHRGGAKLYDCDSICLVNKNLHAVYDATDDAPSIGSKRYQRRE